MKIAFVSLGCDKNTVDSEMMLGLLYEAGHEIVYDDMSADAVVINTCAFILDAQKESIDTILEYARRKNAGQLRYIIITGCLGQRFTDEITASIPEVDAILGIQSFDKLASVIEDLVSRDEGNLHTDKNTVRILEDTSNAPICGHKRLLTTPVHYAYLKIAEGCSKACTYCIIPRLRGPYRSIPMEVLLKEAADLADRGVKELILVAQETTLYGSDLYGEKSLHKLIRELAAIEGIEHIRLLYCYPEEIYDGLIDVFKTEPKLYHYIDMPIQHASDDVLRRMGRRTDNAGIRSIVDRLRKEIPDICIRTTLITGFPGEKMSDFKILKEFVKNMRFDRLGVFPYSPEDGTAAYKMPHQIPKFLREKRRDTIMRIQQEIAIDLGRSLVGSKMNAVIEGNLPDEGVYVARSYRDAPDVDGLIFVKCDRELLSGVDLELMITGTKGYDLTAVPVAEE